MTEDIEAVQLSCTSIGRKYFVARVSMPPGNRVMREEQRTNHRYKNVDTTSREKNYVASTRETKRLREG